MTQFYVFSPADGKIRKIEFRLYLLLIYRYTTTTYCSGTFFIFPCGLLALSGAINFFLLSSSRSVSDGARHLHLLLLLLLCRTAEDIKGQQRPGVAITPVLQENENEPRVFVVVNIFVVFFQHVYYTLYLVYTASVVKIFGKKLDIQQQQQKNGA